jgi:hypothetical protein
MACLKKGVDASLSWHDDVGAGVPLRRGMPAYAGMTDIF